MPKTFFRGVSSRRPQDSEVGNRKLIRASISDVQDRKNSGREIRKNRPPEQTNAENFYYQKQMQSKTPMVIVLCDGEEIHGVIEWYDRSCIKVTRNGAANLMIYKPSIKYLYKEGENSK